MADTITPLSEDWTLADIFGLVRTLANELSGDKIGDEILVDMIHSNVCDIAEALGEATGNDYVEKKAVTQTDDIISLSGLRLDKILKLVDSVAGLVRIYSLKEFEGIKRIKQEKEAACIYATQYGRKMELFKGDKVETYGTLTLSYKRSPIKAKADADYIDLPDKYMNLLISKTKITLYETLQMQPPDNLAQEVTNQVQNLRDANAKENAQIQAQ